MNQKKFVFHFAKDELSKKVRVKRGQFLVYCFAFLNQEGKRDITVELEEGAQAHIYGIFWASGKKDLHINTFTNHLGRSTKARTTVRGVLFDNAKADFSGMIKINKHAQQANSYLDERVLILSRNAESKAKPCLEIYADSVQAGHSATAGHIDHEQLFYLRSRGLSETQAQHFIIMGFLKEVINKIEDEKIRESILKQLYGKTRLPAYSEENKW